MTNSGADTQLKKALTSNHPALRPTGPDDWDSLIDNPLNIGPFSPSIKADDWWVIIGMHVTLPQALADRPAGTTKLLVFADTISIGIPRTMEMQLNDGSDVLLMGAQVNQYYGCTFHRGHHPARPDVFRVAVLGQTFTPKHSRWLVTVTEGFPSRKVQYDLGDGRQPLQTEFRVSFGTRPYTESTTHSRSPLPISGPHFDACRTFLDRLLLTAQSLFDDGRPADAKRLLGRIETLVALNPGVASWQEIAAQCMATREMLQPQLPGSDRVPDLSPDVYSGVVGVYGPALKAIADTFQQFVNRAGDINQRARAARLILDERSDVIKFQALVTKQLTDNFALATDNVSRAQTSIESQSGRVDEAEKAFQRGLTAWRTQQEREAAMAIAGAVFSFVGGVAKIFAGNPAGAASAAAAAEAAAKAATKVQKLIELMKKLAKLVALIATIVKMCKEIVEAAGRISNARDFAARMADVVYEAESGGLDDAPSANAYWDQLWVEVETALAPAVNEGVAGAVEYLKELKVMVIYGRALTSAQAAIPPIAQELARASLLAELAKRQKEAVAKEVEILRAGQPASAMAAVHLWLRHRSVQRAMFTALQDFDAAHRYWALTVARPQRNPSRSIRDLADDLLDIADLQVSVQRALASFRPGPQPLKPSFEVPATAVADFLRDGSFAIRFTPDFGPVADWDDVGRVRVHEVRAWVIWNEGERPISMEFTIRTDGDYYDQRVESGEVKEFRFIGPRVDRTFRYNPVRADRSREDSITAHARVAEDFRAQYSEPTLFTGWQFSLPRRRGLIDPAALKALQGAVKGIELEFSGTYLKDAERF